VLADELELEEPDELDEDELDEDELDEEFVCDGVFRESVR